jgi:hypothetical protein
MGGGVSKSETDLQSANHDDVKHALSSMSTEMRHKLTVAAVEIAGADASMLDRTSSGASCTFIFLRADKLRESSEEKLLTLQDIRRLHPDWLVRREVTFKDVCTGALLRIILSVSHRWETPIDPDPDGKQFSVLKQRLCALPEVELVWIECVKCAS